MKGIKIPFGAKDSELVEATYFIPEGMEAVIEGDKVIIRRKESEDEKIRKALINVFATHKDYEMFFGVSVEDIRTWLERQGEHANFRNKIQVGDKVTRNEDGVLVNLSQLNRVAKKNEKQCETSPVLSNSSNIGKVEQWSEEDERLCQCLIEDQKEALDKVNNDKYGHSEIISDLKEMYHERIDWLKSLKDKVQPQNKWKPSDEQMHVLRNLAEASIGFQHSKTLISLYDDLKKL